MLYARLADPVPPAAAAAPGVVEGAVPAALGAVVHPLGPVGATRVTAGPRPAAAGRGDRRRAQDHPGDHVALPAVVPGRQRVRLHEGRHPVHAR